MEGTGVAIDRERQPESTPGKLELHDTCSISSPHHPRPPRTTGHQAHTPRARDERNSLTAASHGPSYGGLPGER